MQQLSENIWIVDRPQRFYGLEVGTRMTVIRLYRHPIRAAWTVIRFYA